MRISDWSSDVCSSDLKQSPCESDQHKQEKVSPASSTYEELHIQGASIPAASTPETTPVMQPETRKSKRKRENLDNYPEYRQQKNGRASCRERVCQNV